MTRFYTNREYSKINGLLQDQLFADDVNDPDKAAKYPWLLELGLDDFDLESLSTKWTENIINIYGFNLDCIEN